MNYYKENRKSITENKTDKLLYDAIFIGLTTEREKLYDIINKRVDKMLEEGLVEEVQSFYNKKIYTKPLINGIGYKEVYKYLNKEISYEEMKELIKKNSRHYAKRQYTFFNNQFDEINWYDVEENTLNQIVNKIV